MDSRIMDKRFLEIESLNMDCDEVYDYLSKVYDLMAELMDNRAGLDVMNVYLLDLQWFNYFISLSRENDVRVVRAKYSPDDRTFSVTFCKRIDRLGPGGWPKTLMPREIDDDSVKSKMKDLLVHTFSLPSFGGEPEDCAKAFLRLCVDNQLQNGERLLREKDEKIREIEKDKEGIVERMAVIREAYTENGVLEQ